MRNAGDFGYAGKILRVGLSSLSITDIPTAKYADRFIGGRGIAAKIYWDEVCPEVNAFDPENRLIFVTGPLAGFTGLSSSRWEVCGKSPATAPEHFCYSNLGGSWGAHLKFAGYDGIVIQGKSERPVYLLVQDGTAELRDASPLWGKNSVEVRGLLKGELGDLVRVVAIGPAGENMVSMATLLADDDSSGSCGLGAVMGSKKLKAIVVRGSARPTAANPEKLQELTKYIRELQWGKQMKPAKWVGVPVYSKNMRQQVCYGCTLGCGRGTYEATDGDKGKFYCQSCYFYLQPAINYYGELNEVPFHATRLCDKYGLDTKAISPIMEWLSRCYEAGILTDENTGIPISKLGSMEFIETLVKKISFRDGFGDVLAQGIYRAADSVGSKAKEMLTDYAWKAGQIATWGPRLFIFTGLFYAVEPRQPIGELSEIITLVLEWLKWVNRVKGAYVCNKVLRDIAKRFWGSEIAVDFSTYEGKALAAKMSQEREYARECLIRCYRSWPIIAVEHSEDHIGDPTVESRLYSAVTGNEVDEEKLNKIGERVVNLKRAILAREGHRGRESDQLAEFNYTVPIESESNNPQCLVPGKDGEPISRKGAVVDREKFEKVQDEYYQLMGWDVPAGLQTKAKLRELGLEDIATDLEQRGLIV